MKSSSNFSKFQASIDSEERYQYMSNIPPQNGRYIIVDTETTGMSKADHLVELGAHEIINGKLTGAQFHIYIKPRVVMSQSVIKIHGVTNEYYDKCFKDSYHSDKYNMEQFLKFVGSSLIFAHNAPFDLTFINNELRFWDLQTIDPKRFRCTMRIFYNVVSNANPLVQSVMNLRKCCEYFNLEINEDKFHSALFDSLMTSKMICKVYELLDKNKTLRENKNINYTANTIEMFLNTNGSGRNCGHKKKYSDLHTMINKMKQDKENIEKDPKRKFANLFYIAKKTMKPLPKYSKANNNSSSNGNGTQLNQIQQLHNKTNNNYNNNKTLNSFVNVQPQHEHTHVHTHSHAHSHTHSPLTEPKLLSNCTSNPEASSSPDIDDELLQFIEESNATTTTIT